MTEINQEWSSLRDLCLQGIKNRYCFDPDSVNLNELEQEVISRMDFELEVLNQNKSANDFLMVLDVLQYARKNGIMVGPGRGSLPSSIVAYLTEITEIEPLKNNLLFEFFLNPETGNQPVFEFDVEKDQCDKVIRYADTVCESTDLRSRVKIIDNEILGVIHRTIDNIRKTKGEDVDVSLVPEDDSQAIAQLCKPIKYFGLNDVCQRAGIATKSDLIPFIALEQLGTTQITADFIDRKTDKTPVEYDHPDMEQYLKETYGIMIYQEQVVQLVQVLAGFSLEDADSLIQASGNNDTPLIKEHENRFIKGCAEFNDINENLASMIWEKMLKLATTGTSKAHCSAYADLIYRMAFLQSHYPDEFGAASNSCGCIAEG